MIPMQTVIIPNKYNERLVGLLHEAGSKPIVVLCHGFRSSKDDSTIKAITTALTREGISAFHFDFSGNGESDGSFQYGNYWKEVEDLRSVVEYLSGAQRKIIAIVGHSKGGNAVLLYASKYHDVDTVVNVCGRFDLCQGIVGRLGKDFMEKIKNDIFIDVKDRNGKFEYRVTEESLMDRLSTDMHVASPMIDKNCRVLTIHGTKDEIVPVEDALEFDKLIPNHKLHTIEGANHVYSSHGSELASTVVDFIKAGYLPENQQSQEVPSCPRTRRLIRSRI
ncbi:mycophenolic acid acyl-glucuronide esterase, mitochondrial isoform X3 [Amborella trichopoda]|uniref:mycophenolic acid acyl-glucuronide esterase, mitochondrial isoform X1 n=1 Tax=Amborella trichopoda TaxID=13333 RepID=UPI0005D43B52|nr:mycophenolic acid acyl-glucuronide esterase, mitochondrial isoform X1 [Amborella trichopoda]XP_020530223.1 mycophenolic acid acyl-glucuronide esterase, mitochondrial isoform X2 [Amborella trichopoda]XP_020530224.1 mycophenolic acid acyl-glucuronide esterase, mitochondrial isoform X3 [Amborella trichopoda]|eukprot:XP_011627674.1 mycophenolic acid acyl-glucuronide esterase, mitochondrial isoform X1 [Amborella trichopoda]